MSERATGSIPQDPDKDWSFCSAEETSQRSTKTFNELRSSGRIGETAEMKNHKNSASHHDWELGLLKSDRELAVEYLKMAMESLDNPKERGGALLSIRAVAEAYGGLGAVAAQAGISRESLYRALSPKGNPTLKTLIAVLKTLGLRLSVAENHQQLRKSAKKRGESIAA